MTLDFPRSALIVIDLQNDFFPGGALGIKQADMVLEPLKRLASLFVSHSGRVIATQDWHPADHVSFASSHAKAPGETVDTAEVAGQILWLDHCVQGQPGAELHKVLDLRPVNLIIRKGFRRHLDSYSAFYENDRKTPTGLDGFLKSLSIDTLVLGGLATDYCVLYSALDAAEAGYKTIVALDAAKGVDDTTVEKALKLLGEAGVILAETKDIR